MEIKQEEQIVPLIEFIQNGPILVRGLQSLKDSQRQALAPKEKISLCRCGASANKPFCDGSHKTVGFSDKRVNVGLLNKETQYRGEKVTIHDNRRICSHAAECVNHLSTVLKFDERP